MSVQSPIDRFTKKYVVLPNGCWEWGAAKFRSGYGGFGLSGKIVYSHRFAYEYFVGPIPNGLQIDHLCRNRACVNPTHLEPVTRRENILRGENFSALNAAKTQCEHGHPFNEMNTYFRPDGRRECRACKRGRDQRYAAKVKRVFARSGGTA